MKVNEIVSQEESFKVTCRAAVELDETFPQYFDIKNSSHDQEFGREQCEKFSVAISTNNSYSNVAQYVVHVNRIKFFIRDFIEASYKPMDLLALYKGDEASQKKLTDKIASRDKFASVTFAMALANLASPAAHDNYCINVEVDFTITLKHGLHPDINADYEIRPYSAIIVDQLWPYHDFQLERIEIKQI